MQRRSSCSSAPRRALARLLLLALLVPPLPARAEIAGERVVAGEVDFEQAGDVTTIHASDGAIIHYDALNVWAHEELHFVQPDAQSRVLNQVFGDATHIDGGLFANGIVYILNPAGIFFGGEAVVDVGGLVAAAGHMEAADFLAGRDQFELTGAVENAGRIEAVSVALLGRRVANHGSIRVPDGTLALVAGERVLLTRPGAHLHVQVEGPADDSAGFAVEHTGTADAGDGSVRFTTGDVYSLALNHQGITRGRDVELRAASGRVRVAGEIDARGGAGERGGGIAVTGELVSLEGAALDASGGSGGGRIRVGGDPRGAGPLPRARGTAVDAESRLRADALDAGDGGTVIVFSEQATRFAGEISARGGAGGGDGGFAELSGRQLVSRGRIDLGSLRGRSGTLLYDPQDIVIMGGMGVDDEMDPLFVLFEENIEATDASLVLQADNSITSDGVFGGGALELIAGNSISLETRNAAGDDAGSPEAPGIRIDDADLRVSGAGSISIESGTAAEGVDAPVLVADLGTGGGQVRLDASAGSITTGAIGTAGAPGDMDTDGGSGGAVRVDTADGSIAVASVSTAGGAGRTGGAGGAITLDADDADASGGDGVTVTGTLLAAGGAGLNGSGGAGGAVTVRTAGSIVEEVGNAGMPDEVTYDVQRGGGAVSLQDVDTRGGAGVARPEAGMDPGDPGDGGRGGAVDLTARGGDLDVGRVDGSGGGGEGRGGAAGAIALTAVDLEADGGLGAGPGVGIEATDDLVARGGDSGAGGGGSGGSVTVRTQGGDFFLGTREGAAPGDPLVAILPERGGGSVRLVDVDTRGGSGTGIPDPENPGELLDEGDGGAGGVASLFGIDAVTIEARGGTVEVGEVDTSGGAGDGRGGAAGPVSISVLDLQGANDGDTVVITTGTLRAEGGAGSNGTGGRGGSIRADTVASQRIDDPAGTDEMPLPPLQESAGGGTVSVAAVAADGGDGSRGGAGGRFTVEIDGVNDLALGFAPSIRGGQGTSEGGGAGGALTLVTQDGSISLPGSGGTSVDVRGGTGATSGGSAGSITLRANDLDASGGSDVVVDGALLASGLDADAGGGSGGFGGSVTLRTAGGSVEESEDIGPPGEPDVVDFEVERGGGSISVAGAIDTRGGAGVARADSDPGDEVDDSDPGNAGRGGNVTATARGGDIDLVSIDSSGGDGDGAGGNAGGITLTTTDLDPTDVDGVEDTVTATSLTALGGEGDEGAGGSGGTVSVQTFGSPSVANPGEPGEVLRESEGGGAVALGAIAVGGGDGFAGGFGGGLTVSVSGATDLDLGLAVSARGGEGSTEGGGSGGIVQLVTEDGGITLPGDAAQVSIDVGGGGGATIGGGGGQVLVQGGDRDAMGGSDVQLAGGVLARGGDGTTGTGGAGGSVEVRTLGGDVELAEDVAAPRGGGSVGIGADAGGLSVDVSGGLGGAPAMGEPGSPGSGGAGGSTTLVARGGALDVQGGVDASGGDGAAGGGVGGGIGLFTLDINAPEGATSLTLDAVHLDASGGSTSADDVFAGQGGSVVARSAASERIEDPGDPDVPLQESLGGGAVNVASVDVRGGDGVGFNGSGGSVGVISDRGDVAVGTVTSRPGMAAGALEGLSGVVSLRAGIAEEDATGNLDLTGDVDGLAVVIGAADAIALAATAEAIDADGGALRIEGASLDAAGGLTLSADTALGLAVGDTRVADDLLVSTPATVALDREGDQTITAANITFDREGRSGVPRLATVGKAGGALTLSASGGAIVVPDGDKISAAGGLTLNADRVRVTDLSATGISVISPDLEIFARQPAEVQLDDGGTTDDLGTDVIATTVSFSSAPEVFGGGAAPRIATRDGTAAGSGALEVRPLGVAVRADQIAPQGPDGPVLDLSIPISQPGNETQEFDTSPVEVPQDLWISADAAPAAGPGPELMAMLECRARDPRRDCIPGSAGPGSPLRTERAAELAERYRALLGSREALRALAEAAARPDASLVRPDTRATLLELAGLLTRVRMLGLDDAQYRAARDALLGEVAGAVEGLDAERLRRAVEQVGADLPIT